MKTLPQTAPPTGRMFVERPVGCCWNKRSDAVEYAHSFAVSTIVDDYREGAPGSRLAILSTYLGHVEPSSTYWYLSAAPELLALAGERLDRHLRADA